MKIGVFDSGIGGLTVLAELKKALPQVTYVYWGDTANVPYGTKSAEHIQRLSRASVRELKARGIDLLVVACNTASSQALEVILDEADPVPVFGVVEPGVECALKAYVDVIRRAANAPILVLATRATVRSQAYSRVLRAIEPQAHVIEQACPLLVPLIEEGWVDHEALHLTLREYLSPYARAYSTGVALLGCTHYPWITAAVQKALPGWTVVNSAQAVAQAVASSSEVEKKGDASVEWNFTDPTAVPEFARKWMAEGMSAKRE